MMLRYSVNLFKQKNYLRKNTLSTETLKDFRKFHVRSLEDNEINNEDCKRVTGAHSFNFFDCCYNRYPWYFHHKWDF